MGYETSDDKGPQPLLWAGSLAGGRKITGSGIPDCLNCCVILIVYTQLTNVAAGRRFKTHALR